MCGIVGKIYFEKNKLLSEDLIKKMCSVLIHRGPDSEGIFVDRNVGLGVRRLAVIDLQTGDQPIHNEDKTVWIVLDGKIYNFLQLRSELEEKGHKFYTKTDTEVILHLYEEYQENCVKFLQGMFAFAIWDKKKETLILAKDRLGKKPLCYSLNNNSLIFASEIKAILEDSQIKPEINLVALDYYLTYKHIPSPFTIFTRIKKLPPATVLVCKNGDVKFIKYWQLDFSKKMDLTEEEYKKEIIKRLTEAVKIRLISDVPLGAFLSGGIDSSIIVGIMSQLTTTPVKTFTTGFEEKDYSEIEYARIVSKHFHTEHYEFIVKPDIIEILPELVWYYNEPYADSSSIVTYYLAKMTRKYVTVALNGDGGDENFAGYGWYHLNKYFYLWDKLPKITKNLAMKLKIERIQKYIGYAKLDYPNRYFKFISYFTPELKEKLYQPWLKEKLKKIHPEKIIIDSFSNCLSKDILDKHLYTDITNYLVDDLLVKMDIATMANSLEARSPFLDHKFVEFCASIPAEFKLRHFTTKYILKKTFSDFLPKKIIKRKKHGFVVPIKRWFQTDLKEYIKSILLSENSSIKNYFQISFIKEMLNAHISGKINYAGHIWALLNFELWHKKFID